MATAAVACTPPPPSSARLPPIRTSFLTPPTTALSVSYRGGLSGAGTVYRPATVRRPETITLGREEVQLGGGRGISVSDADMTVRGDDRIVQGKAIEFGGAVHAAEDEDSPSEYSDDGSRYSDEDEESEGEQELPTTFSDPGHYAYTERARPGDVQTTSNAPRTARVRDSFNPAPPTALQAQHARPSAPSPLSARVGRPVLQLRPKVQFAIGEDRAHGASQESPTTSLTAPIEPSIHTPPLGAYFSTKPSIRPSMNEHLPGTRRHRYTTSDPSHSFVTPPSPDTDHPNPSTRARTMPGYRTAHTPLPARAYRDTRPNNLDAIVESATSTNPYGHVYTGIPTPYARDVSEVGEVRQGIAFPCWGSKSTIAVGRASVSTIALGGQPRGRTVSNKLRKAPPAKKNESRRGGAGERARKLSSASARRSPVRSPSPVKRARTVSFGYLSRMRMRLRRRSDARQVQAKTQGEEGARREASVRPLGMEGYLVEPFGGNVRPTSCLSTATTQTFFTTRVAPESRPMSITSLESAYTYTNMAAGSEEGGRRASVAFEDEERALRAWPCAHAMSPTAHDAAYATTTAPATVMSSIASGTPFSTSTSTTSNHHPATHHNYPAPRPPPLPTNDSSASSSSGAMASTATSATSCTSGGWRSSAGSTPPTSPDASDVSGCGQAHIAGHESYFSHDTVRSEDTTVRERAQSENGHEGASSPSSPRKGKLMKKRPAAVSMSGAEMPPREKTRPSVDNGAVPGPSRTKSILGLRLGSSREKTKEREGRLASVAEWTEGVEYLPQLRPPSPLWAGSSGKLPSPYSRLSASTNCLSDNQFDDMNPTNALASLAFTGNSSALSSSALAALTSRLTHRASNEVLTASAASSVRGSLRRSKRGKPVDAPPWTAAFSVTPIEQGVKLGSENEAMADLFDPYAETRNDARKQRSSMSFLNTLRPSPRLPTLETEPIVPRVRTRRAPRRDNSPNTLRRWTLAMADVPDEVLVQELEKLRMEGRGAAGSASASPARRKRRTRLTESSELGHDDEWKIVGGESGSDYSTDERDPSPAPSTSHHGSQSHSGSSSHQMHSAAHLSMLDDHEWKTARRALLCCRELVRTERNYQERLRALLSGETSTPPPSLVLTYVPALLRASEALLSRLEDDPSAWGVSAAFVAVEEEVESALVAWAGVVGEIFVGPAGLGPGERAGRKLTRASRNSSFSSVNDAAAKSLAKRSRSGASLAPALDSIYRPRGVSMIDTSATPGAPLPPRPASTAAVGLFTAALGTGLAYGIAPAAVPARDERAVTTSGGSGTLSRTLGAFKARKSAFGSSPSLSPHAHTSSPVSPTFSFGKDEEREREKEKEKRPAVRELAILPVQRVMRYVLQYRDLLENTPVESPSRGLVERALESATRIAAKCDRAQDNSAFFLRRV